MTIRNFPIQIWTSGPPSIAVMAIRNSTMRVYSH